MQGARRCLVCLVYVIAAALCFVGTAAAFTQSYTTDADFDGGVLVGVEHDSVHDQLQLVPGSGGVTTFPFIWVPNNEGTVSKVSTETGDELGRYWVAPFSNSSPSRTTVDLDGNCWVGCRQAGTVVKIGLLENDQWIDRNDDSICQTSEDLNDDGNITSDEMLPWGEDECVLVEVVLVAGSEGPYTPGTYTGPYDTNYYGVAPRGLGIDADNNLWAGTFGTQTYYYINGTTGAIIRTIDMSPWGHTAYGAVSDANGVLWSSNSYNQVLFLNPNVEPPLVGTADVPVYGVGLDFLGHVFAAGGSSLSRINIADGSIDWTQSYSGYGFFRGVAATSDNDMWVADSGGYAIRRFDNDGNYKATISVPSGMWDPTGVAVDAAGKVWACDNGDEYIHRIDPATNTIDLSKQIIGSGGHYTYSDMTGSISKQITAKSGTWTTICDSGVSDAYWWAVLSWTSLEPAGTSVTVNVRTSNDQVTWSGWEAAINGMPLPTALRGQYLQIEARLRTDSIDLTPVLYDLTISDYTGRVLDVGDGQAGPGRIGTVPVVFNDASGMAGLQFDVTYNLGQPGLLTFVTARKGSALPEEWEFDFNVVAENRLRIIAYSPTVTPLPAGSNGVIAELDFEVSAAAQVDDHCALHPHSILVSDEMGLPISPVSGADGVFTVIPPVDHFNIQLIPAPPEPQGGDSIEPLPFSVYVEARDEYESLVTTYNGSPWLSACVGTADPSIIEFVNGVWTGSVKIYADIDPACILVVCDAGYGGSASEEFQLCAKGDVDGSGEVNVFDVIRAVRIALDLAVTEPPREEFRRWAANMNYDQDVNVFDVIQIVNKSLGRLSTGRSIAGASGRSSKPTSVSLVSEGHGVWAVRVSNAQGLAGAQLELDARCQGVSAGELTTGWAIQSNDVNGRLRVIAYSPSATPLSQSQGVLLRLTGVKGKPKLVKILLSDPDGQPI